MKVRGRRPRAFVVSRCFYILMKPEARGFEMTSQSRILIKKRYFHGKHLFFVVVCSIITYLLVCHEKCLRVFHIYSLLIKIIHNLHVSLQFPSQTH